LIELALYQPEIVSPNYLEITQIQDIYRQLFGVNNPINFYLIQQIEDLLELINTPIDIDTIIINSPQTQVAYHPDPQVKLIFQVSESYQIPLYFIY
jgi:hypothetical protein